MFPPYTEINLQTKIPQLQQLTMENTRYITHPPELIQMEYDNEFEDDEFEVICVYHEDYYNYDPVHAVYIDLVILNYR